MLSGSDLEATVLGGRIVDRHHHGDEERGIGRPTGLLVLMRLEPIAAWQLEVDLVLEHHGRLSEELRRAGKERPVQQAIEVGVKGTEILDPLDEAGLLVAQARLAINHVATGNLRRGQQFGRPPRQIGDCPIIE